MGLTGACVHLIETFRADGFRYLEKRFWRMSYYGVLGSREFLESMFIERRLRYERLPASTTIFEPYSAAIYQYGDFRMRYLR